MTPDLATKNLGAKLSGTLDDSYWGKWIVSGRLAPGFKRGDLTLSGNVADANGEKCLSIPFVPSVVWTHVAVDGALDVSLFLAFDVDSKAAPISTKTTIVAKGATLSLLGVNLDLANTTGTVVVDGDRVRFSGIEGTDFGGKIGGDGSLDFGDPVPKLRLDLRLNRLEVAKLREKWLPDAPNLVGRLDGGADLAIAFADGMIDLTGTTGSAKIADAMVEGLPIDRLNVSLVKDRSVAGDLAEQPLIPGARIPGTLVATGAWNGVEAREVVDRLVALGVMSPLPVSGKLTVKVNARAPLDGRLKRPRGFKIAANATLVNGSLFRVPIARVSGKLDLDRGVLSFQDVQGRLAPQKDPKAGTPLAFKGFGSVAVDPLAQVIFHLETEPFSPAALAEVLGPRTVPIEGNVSLNFDARADAGRLSDPAAWTGDGVLQSARLVTTVKENPKIVLADLKTPIRLTNGCVELPELAATLEGEPVNASLKVDLKAPFAFAASGDFPRRDLGVWLARFGEGPTDSSGFDGVLSGKIESKGTLEPFSRTVAGSGLLAKFRMENSLIGDLPFRFELPQTGRLVVRVIDAKTFGGVVSAEVRAPVGRTETRRLGSKARQLSRASICIKSFRFCLSRNCRPCPVAQTVDSRS